MYVIIRVDASLKMGTGHVMRCLTLAQALKENGANVEFICRKHEGSLIDKIRSSEFVVHELKVFEETEVDTKLAHSHWLGATQQQDAGQFYWSKRGQISNEIMFGKDSIPILLPRHLVQDIDSLEDWRRAEFMYQVLNKNKDKLKC